MKKWYVIQVYAGYEDQVAEDLKKTIKKYGKEDLFGDVLLPSAKIKSYFAAEASQDQVLFPGYVLVEMILSPEAINLVKSVPRVLKFLGGNNPLALSKKEVEKINAAMQGEVKVVSEEKEFVEGSEVDITAGPFAGFVGLVETVDRDNQRLTVMVSIFGRMTPVELNFDQVKR